MSKSLSITIFVINIVVNNKSEFLMVQEAKPSIRGSWFFPAGRKKPKETLIDAAIRETEEESGIICEPRAFVNIVHQMNGVEAFQVLMISEPIKGQLKTTETKDTIQAQWVSKEAINKLQLRTVAVLDIIEAYEKQSFVPIKDFYQY
jgi:ADP-ribose pyrophosphatase YjhB (NUDIX family)